MKVLIVTNYFTDASRGGVEFHVQSLAQGLKALGHRVTVLRTSEYPQIFEVKGIEILSPFAKPLETRYSLHSSVLSKLPGLRMLSNFIYRIKLGKSAVEWIEKQEGFLEDFDLVHHHDFVTSAIVSSHIARKHKAIPQFWTNHLGEFILLNNIPIVGNLITKRMTMRYDYAFAPSTELASQRGIHSPVEMIPNGADCDIFKPLPTTERALIREELGWEPSELVAIVPRRWGPTKGVLYVAQALAELPPGLKLRCVFVGSKESDYEEYAARVSEALNKSQTAIEILGSVGQAEMSKLLSASDICIIPSLFEAVSLSALESLACETPVLSTNVGGLPEVVIPNRTGWLIPPKRSDEIEKMLLTLLKTDRGVLRTIGHNGRQLVQESYSWDAVARKVSARYGK